MKNVPETIACLECDAELTGLAEAIQIGWIELQFAGDNHHANYVGICPDCRLENIKEADRTAAEYVAKQ